MTAPTTGGLSEREGVVVPQVWLDAFADCFGVLSHLTPPADPDLRRAFFAAQAAVDRLLPDDALDAHSTDAEVAAIRAGRSHLAPRPDAIQNGPRDVADPHPAAADVVRLVADAFDSAAVLIAGGCDVGSALSRAADGLLRAPTSPRPDDAPRAATQAAAPTEPDDAPASSGSRTR